MSRRVPRTLRTLKLDYREIAALLPGPPFLSLSSAPEPARLPPPPVTPTSSSSSFSNHLLSCISLPQCSPSVSSDLLLIHLRYVVPRVLPLVRIACIATDGRTYLVGSFTCVASSAVQLAFPSSSFASESLSPFAYPLSPLLPSSNFRFSRRLLFLSFSHLKSFCSGWSSVSF